MIAVGEKICYLKKKKSLRVFSAVSVIFFHSARDIRAPAQTLLLNYAYAKVYENKSPSKISSLFLVTRRYSIRRLLHGYLENTFTLK